MWREKHGINCRVWATQVAAGRRAAGHWRYPRLDCRHVRPYTRFHSRLLRRVSVGYWICSGASAGSLRLKYNINVSFSFGSFFFECRRLSVRQRSHTKPPATGAADHPRTSGSQLPRTQTRRIQVHDDLMGGSSYRNGAGLLLLPPSHCCRRCGMVGVLWGSAAPEHSSSGWCLLTPVGVPEGGGGMRAGRPGGK